MLVYEKQTNATVCQIDNLERLLVKIDKDPKRVMSMILDI